MYQIIWFRCFIISLYWVQPHLHLYRIMVQFWKLQILRRIRNTEDKKSGFGENWKLIFLGDIWRDLCVHKSLVVMSAISIIIWFVEIFVFFVEQKLINHRRLWRILETPKMAVLADKLKSITNLFALFVSTNLSFFLQELASSFSMLVHHLLLLLTVSDIIIIMFINITIFILITWEAPGWCCTCLPRARSPHDTRISCSPRSEQTQCSILISTCQSQPEKRLPSSDYCTARLN